MNRPLAYVARRQAIDGIIADLESRNTELTIQRDALLAVVCISEFIDRMTAEAIAMCPEPKPIDPEKTP